MSVFKSSFYLCVGGDVPPHNHLDIRPESLMCTTQPPTEVLIPQSVPRDHYKTHDSQRHERTLCGFLFSLRSCRSPLVIFDFLQGHFVQNYAGILRDFSDQTSLETFGEIFGAYL